MHKLKESEPVKNLLSAIAVGDWEKQSRGSWPRLLM